ncbi:MAG: PepSY domain-containing protein [Shewanella sp.]
MAAQKEVSQVIPKLAQAPHSYAPRKRIKRAIKIVHYWLGTLVSLQLLIWLITGVYFNLTPHERLKGMEYNHSHHLEQQQKSLFNAAEIVDVTPLLNRFHPVEKLTLVSVAGKPVYILDAKVKRYAYQRQNQTLIDAYSGNVINIDAKLAQTIALESYMGPGMVTDIQKISPPIREWPQQCNSLWKFDMDDDLATRIYINAVNGELVGHKNSHTDIADFMFKFHFMDYLNQGSFNNPFSWLFGILSLLFSLSGLYWVLDNVICNRYRLKR